MITAGRGWICGGAVGGNPIPKGIFLALKLSGWRLLGWMMRGHKPKLAFRRQSSKKKLSFEFSADLIMSAR